MGPLPVARQFLSGELEVELTPQGTLAEKLRAGGVRLESHRYLAQHGFANETAQGPGRLPITQYDATWAQQAWDRTLVFVGAQLG